MNKNKKRVNEVSTNKLLTAIAIIILTINVVNAQYDSTNKVSENYIPTLDKTTQKWGYVNELDSIMIPFIYTDVSKFKSGFAFVSTRRSFTYTIWKVITTSGKEIILPEVYDRVNMFKNKLFVFAGDVTIYNIDGMVIEDNTEKYISEFKSYIFQNKDDYIFWDHPLLLSKN